MPPHWRNRTPKANLYWIPMLVMSPSLASSTSGKAHLESDLYVQYSMVARSSPLRRLNTERLNWKYAAYHFIVKNHSYLCPRNFTMRVDNQALSWLKTIGRWIMTLEKYNFRVEHRPEHNIAMPMDCPNEQMIIDGGNLNSKRCSQLQSAGISYLKRNTNSCP